MKKVFLTSVASLALVFPALADIDKSASTATCDSATIGATSGNAYMDTAWTANTINLQWYSNGEQIDVSGTDSATCTYDGAIELPNDPEDKTGYTFGGWKVRVASNNNNNQTPITLSSLYATGDIDTFSSKSLNPGVYCEGKDNGDNYGHDEDGDCTDSRFSGLNNGEWRVTMPNGSVVKGEARCSTVGSGYGYAKTGNPTDDLDLNNLNNGARFCWCQATGADTTGNGTYQSVAGSRWVYTGGRSRASACATACANNCAGDVIINADVRRAVFGVSE